MQLEASSETISWIASSASVPTLPSSSSVARTSLAAEDHKA
jgi:hypothetical protein